MFGSYFFSILLHLALVLLVFFWPASPPIKLDQPMMQISVNMALRAATGWLRPCSGRRQAHADEGRASARPGGAGGQRRPRSP